jgi:hypothetical protein
MALRPLLLIERVEISRSGIFPTYETAPEGFHYGSTDVPVCEKSEVEGLISAINFIQMSKTAEGFF